MKRLSPLLWPGDKTLLGAEYLELVQPRAGGRVLDPFCGSVGIHMHHAHPLLLGDLDPNLVNLLRKIQNEPTKLQAQHARIPDYETAMKNITHRMSMVRAASFLYANRSSRFPHVRYLRDGSFRLPFYHSHEFPREAVQQLSERLQGVPITLGDYGWVMKAFRPEDVVLLDPPYIGNGRMYHGDEFDYPRLFQTAKYIGEQGARAVVSLNYSEDTLEYFKDCPRVLIMERSSKGFKADAQPSREIVGVYET